MAAPLRIRLYRPSDRDACLALFDGNTPGSFLPEERPQFAAFIDAPPGPYLVAEEASGRVVACGGLAAREPSAAVLCWGMVDAARQHEGIGRVLLRVRMAQACAMPGVTQVEMNTSNETEPFFVREGLRTVHVREHYFRPGLHRHDMVCELGPGQREAVRARLAALRAEGHHVDADVLPR